MRSGTESALSREISDGVAARRFDSILATGLLEIRKEA